MGEINKKGIKAILYSGSKVYWLCRGPNDTSKYGHYPDSLKESASIKPSEDPFLNW